MPSLTELCAIDVTLEFLPIGKVQTGMRIDIPFRGTATSPHWDGERSVDGIDFVTAGADGWMNLDIRARMGEGADVVSYLAIGRGTHDGPLEVFTFETASEELGWLNSAVAVAIGQVDGNQLHLDVFAVKR